MDSDGDFNYVLKDEERSSRKGASTSFVEWVDWKGLINLGFSGAVFTWNHGSDISQKRSARLDKGICDEDWRRLFQMAYIEHLSHSFSDHCPVLRHLTPKGGCLGERPFRFHSAWTLHRSFSTWAEKERSYKGNLGVVLKDFAEKLKAWNKHTFGNIFQRKRRIMRRLEGVQWALALNT